MANQIAAREKTIQQQLQQLENTLQELQRTQGYLIQAEKMSSLGQLVAGLSHELNNSINFIHGNAQYAEGYVTELLQLVALYRQQYPHPTPELQDAIAATDLTFLSSDLPKIFESMMAGTQRITAMVQSLRTFSHLDESELKAVDIHAGIESALTVLQHRTVAQPQRPAIAIVRDYSSLPLVECYPGQLNQVFANILENAIDALEALPEYAEPTTQDRVEANDGGTLEQNERQDFRFPSVRARSLLTISIHTKSYKNEWIAIRFTDNGTGIPKNIQNKLFDPFFTTKPTGKGTGLGLSIGYQIITEKHRGTLTCESLPGRGTTFEIEIPIRQRIQGIA